MLAEDKRLLVTDIRHRLDDALANMDIKFFISCVSGTESNSKKAGEHPVNKPLFRASISYFIVHGSKLNLTEIKRQFHNTAKIKFEIKPLRSSNKAAKDSEKKTAEELTMSNHLKQIVKVWNLYFISAFAWVLVFSLLQYRKSLKNVLHFKSKKSRNRLLEIRFVFSWLKFKILESTFYLVVDSI